MKGFWFWGFEPQEVGVSILRALPSKMIGDMTAFEATSSFKSLQSYSDDDDDVDDDDEDDDDDVSGSDRQTVSVKKRAREL